VTLGSLLVASAALLLVGIAVGRNAARVWMALTVVGALLSLAAAGTVLFTGATWEWRSAFPLGGEPIHLTPKELDLLRYLTQHANQVVSHRELLQSVWGVDYGREVDYLRVFIKNLRKKIELNPDAPEYITTEPWVGYRFNGTPESS
jgi:DNA-binding response OmpR family regulator